jgi:hypothetical protein
MRKLGMLALLMLLASAGGIAAQIPDGALALTYCNTAGEPESGIRTDVIESGDATFARMILAHEAKHREQLERWPGCEINLAAYGASLGTRLEIEVEAYCYGLNTVGGAEGPYGEYVTSLVYRIFSDVSPAQVAVAMKRHGCIQ